jgi:sialate O-acetylesterase
MLSIIWLLCGITHAASLASASFHVSNVFGNHMVLQRDRPIVINGFSQLPGDAILGTAGGGVRGKFGPATVDENGEWRLQLPAQPANSISTTLTFTSINTGESISISDVLFGDVHICGGQSNMQFTVSQGLNATAEIAAADAYSLIRVFTVGQKTTSFTPLRELGSIQQPWSIASSHTIGGAAFQYFSAVCWLTYRSVFDALGGSVPQGLISVNWGGTQIEQFVPPAVLSFCNCTKPAYGLSKRWNAMISPFTVGPMSMRTALWYQGEANVDSNQTGPSFYACAFPQLIQAWRSHLGGLNTFGFVQVAPWSNYSNAGAGDLRQSQLAALSLSNVVWASTMDAVWPWSSPDIQHPRNKQLVSARLAVQVLNAEYGIGGDSTPQTPTYGSFLDHIVLGTTLAATIGLNDCGGDAGCLPVSTTLPPGVTPAMADSTFSMLIGMSLSDAKWMSATATFGGDTVALLVLTVDLGSPVPADWTILATRWGRGTFPVPVAVSTSGLPLTPWCALANDDPCYTVPGL